MQASKAKLFTTSSTFVQNCNKIISRNVYKKPFSYEPKYRGGFDQHDIVKYPRSVSAYKEEELLDEVHGIRSTTVENPSPFHIVKRIHGTAASIKGWHNWVTLRRLNLHSTRPGDVALIPNTPQFNALLATVKHLIVLKPAILPDGKIPSEEDIGAIKICPQTGNVIIDEKLRLLAKRQYQKPPLWQGNQLRSKLRSLVGIHGNHHMR